MSRLQQDALTAAMREHERQVGELSLALAHAGSMPGLAQEAQQHVVYLTAQMMKHRISMALLAARLGVAEPSLH